MNFVSDTLFYSCDKCKNKQDSENTVFIDNVEHPSGRLYFFCSEECKNEYTRYKYCSLCDEKRNSGMFIITNDEWRDKHFFCSEECLKKMLYNSRVNDDKLFAVYKDETYNVSVFTAFMDENLRKIFFA